MAVSNLAIFPQKVQAWAVQLSNATGVTIVNLMTAGSNGSIVESLNISSTDSAANQVFVYLNDGSVNHLLAIVAIAALAGGNGTGATPALDVLRSGIIPGLPVDANGNYIMYVPSGYSIKIGANTTITSGKTWDAVAMGSDY